MSFFQLLQNVDITIDADSGFLECIYKYHFVRISIDVDSGFLECIYKYH